MPKKSSGLFETSYLYPRPLGRPLLWMRWKNASKIEGLQVNLLVLNVTLEENLHSFLGE